MSKIHNQYAGIGSRATPPVVLEKMENLARELAELKWILRSGAADGADLAFDRGSGGRGWAITPWRSFNRGKYVCRQHNLNDGDNDAFNSVDRHHPCPGMLRGPIRRLMARNYRQVVMGNGTPVKMIVCWTPLGSLGGTGQAIRIAEDLGVKVFNLNSTTPENVMAYAKAVTKLQNGDLSPLNTK